MVIVAISHHILVICLLHSTLVAVLEFPWVIRVIHCDPLGQVRRNCCVLKEQVLGCPIKEAGAVIIGTGRSDYPNQVNNLLAFPGIFRGALDAKAKKITEGMKMAAAKALAYLIKDDELTADYILPSAFDERVVKEVSEAVKKAAIEEGVIR